MPTYLYKDLKTGEIYELVQSMRDEPYAAHPETGAAVKRVLARPGIAFKGSGFYVTDSRPKPAEGQSKSDSKSASATPSSGGSSGGGGE